MPFKSKAQQRFMFSQMPEKAKQWAKKTPSMAKLPEKVKIRKKQNKSSY